MIAVLVALFGLLGSIVAYWLIFTGVRRGLRDAVPPDRRRWIVRAAIVFYAVVIVGVVAGFIAADVINQHNGYTSDSGNNFLVGWACITVGLTPAMVLSGVLGWRYRRLFGSPFGSGPVRR